MKRRLLFLLLVAGLLSCRRDEDELPANASGVWTLYDFAEGVEEGESYGGILSSAIVTEAGAPIPFLSPPWASEPALQRKDVDGVNVFPAFSEGKPAAYMTTDVWLNMPPVWIQPMYVLVTQWDPQKPFNYVLPGAMPIFSVSAKSAFYSPYWQVFYVEVPADTPPDRYRSAKDVLDAKLRLHEGPGKNCALAPPGLSGVVAEGATKTVRPLNGAEVGVPRLVQGWVDGNVVGALDFGNNRFVWDEHDVVREEALFTFKLQRPDGSLVGTGLPSIAGIGPLHEAKGVDAPGGKPRFGSLWRIYDVEVPGTAGVFVTSDHPEFQAQMASLGLSAPAVSPLIEARPDAKDFLGRIATKPDCFSKPDQFPQGCGFLDSQAAVEALPDWAIHRTGLTVNCPLVLFNGAAVNP